MSIPPDNDWPAHLERIKRVQREAAAELRSCRGDLLAQLRVCCRYFESGEREDITHEELIDYLGISSSCVLNQAGYSDAESDLLMRSLPLITYDSDGKPRPPAELPHPPSSPPQSVQKDLEI